MPTLEKVRIDKWLWSVRIYKSRTLAIEACKGSRVKINGKAAKPAHVVVVGDEIRVLKNGFNLTIEVTGLIQKRVSAPIAILNYIDKTPSEELLKYKDWFVGKGGVEFREKGTGRPTKKERREIDDYKEWMFLDDEEMVDS